MPWAARRIGRPVKWTADRRECFLSDYHARDLFSEAALALDADGNFLALRGVNTLNLGAYAVYFWPLRKGLSMMQGVLPHSRRALSRACGADQHRAHGGLSQRRPARGHLHDRAA